METWVDGVGLAGWLVQAAAITMAAGLKHRQGLLSHHNNSQPQDYPLTRLLRRSP